MGFTVILGVTLFGYDRYSRYQQTPETIKSSIADASNGGRVIRGNNTSPESTKISTTTNMVYESREIETDSKKANAAVLKWEQTSEVPVDEEQHTDSGEHTKDVTVTPQFRTNNGDEWSEWVDAGSQEDRKDGTAASHDALVLADKITKLQYRFKLTGHENEPSPSIDLSKTSVEVLDTSKGPSPTKPKSLLEKLTGVFDKKASAVAEGPQVFSRADWGSPEPNSSPRWEPEYEPLSQAVVHHTATTQTPDSAAALRAIWEFHANGRGWGDIGYNYIIDHGGNIFQGRYSNWQDEQSQNGEVVGGHAYGNNYGTTGIAVLGNFTSTNPDNRSLQAIGKIAAFKLHRFGINPAQSGARGPNVVGHRDVTSTSCPGERLYGNLPTIRYAGLLNFNTYSSMAQHDIWYRGQGANGVATNSVNLFPGEQAEMYIDLTNTGTENWNNTGANPLRLGTEFPRDRSGLFVSSSWISPNRPTTFQSKVSTPGDPNSVLTPTSVIAPGETGRFAFTAKAPPYVGTHLAYYQPVAEGRTWFLRQLGMHFVFNVKAPRFSWQYVGQSAYTNQTKSTPVNVSSLSRGQRFYAELTVRNTGDKTWNKTGDLYAVKLATSNPHDRTSGFYDSTWMSANRVSMQQETTVQPGQTATFGAWFTVPSNAQLTTHKEYFKLVAEGYTWFNELGMHWPFTVTN